ncbi:protein N-terminal glutamine amidohydrolase isoform X1 [Hydra vulgaris]|uniref:Protein N-terminal glutamine amidohydrolase n=1 Tax=Hydra vulgaris TaxID=6087 RepID=T2M713_HYDVU|nr:protein N-terminal glutamine amidohydrolase [Hydra vulgaris]
MSIDGSFVHLEDKKISSLKALINCVYTSCYCEENVWKLCQQIKESQGVAILKEYFVVFISNKDRKIPLWMQKQGKDPLTPVLWDYHVILTQKPKIGPPKVFDLDSVLSFPCPLDMYLAQAIRSEHNIKKEYHRKFRIIAADDFLSKFASDRSHMLKPNGEYIKPPPDYPPIRTADESMNLDEYIDMTPHFGEGRVKDLKGFVKYYGISFPIT